VDGEWLLSTAAEAVDDLVLRLSRLIGAARHLDWDAN
jgi:hypothetical protein